MRKQLLWPLAGLLCLAMGTSAAAATYTASEQGFGGEVTVTLTIEDGKLTDVAITGDDETPSRRRSCH